MTPEQRNEIRNSATNGNIEEAICKWLGFGELFAKLGGVPQEITAAVHAIRLELETYRDKSKSAPKKVKK